jgi:uncharacterized membrane protein YeaQ/YmgE (transglycosylase-associated protein family)
MTAHGRTRRGSAVSAQSLVLWVVVGLAAGWLASKILGSPHGIIVDLLLGLVGALIGGFVLRVLVKQVGPFTNAQWEQYRVASQQSLAWTAASLLPHIVVAFCGALLLLVLHRLLFPGRRRGLLHA